MQQAFKEYSNQHTLKPGSHFAGFSHSSECTGNFCLCYTHSFRRLSDAFPMFGRRGTLKSCSFEVPIGSDGMLPDAFPMSFRCLILRQEGVRKFFFWGRDSCKGVRKGFERYNMGKGSARHREGIGKALETGIGRHREGIGKQSGKHRKASVRHREGIGKASESIGKASGRHRKASGRHRKTGRPLPCNKA